MLDALVVSAMLAVLVVSVVLVVLLVSAVLAVDAALLVSAALVLEALLAVDPPQAARLSDSASMPAMPMEAIEVRIMVLPCVVPGAHEGEGRSLGTRGTLVHVRKDDKAMCR